MRTCCMTLIAAALALSAMPGCGKDGPSKPKTPSVVGTWDWSDTVVTRVTGEEVYAQDRDGMWYRFDEDSEGMKVTVEEGAERFRYTVRDNHLDLDFTDSNWQEWYSFEVQGNELRLARSFEADGDTYREVITLKKR